MDRELLFLFCLFGLWIPILALLKARQASRQQKELSESFMDIARRLNRLEVELRELRQPHGGDAKEPADSPIPAKSTPSIAEPSSVARPDIPPVVCRDASNPVPVPPLVAKIAETGAKPEPARTAPKFDWQPADIRTTQMPASQRMAINWEHFLGIKLFAWMGALALFLGVGFLVKYSFEQGLISPPMRVAMGLVIGLGLLAGGLAMSREKYATTVQALCAAGILILYADIFAACMFYHFILEPVAFLLMALVTAAAFLLAVRLDAQSVAILALLGGFLTPPLLSTGRDNPMGLFGYLAILDAGLIAVAFRKRWNYLVTLAAIATIVMQAGWVSSFFAASKVETAMSIFLGFAWLFALALAWAHRAGKVDRFVSGAALATPSTALLFALCLVGGHWPSITCRPALLFTFIMGADLALLAAAWLRAELRATLHGAGLAVFLLMAIWTTSHLTPELLGWALGFYTAFAVLHAGLAFYFYGTGAMALQRRLGNMSGAGEGQAKSDLSLSNSDLVSQIPAMSVIPPFLLLVLVVGRLSMADPSPVFCLALLLLGLLLALIRFGQTDGLCAIGLACVFVLEFNWHFKDFGLSQPGVPLAWYIGFYAVFMLFPFLLPRPRAVLPWSVAAAAGPAHFFLIYYLAKAAYPNPWMGLIPALFVLPSLAVLVYLKRTVPSDSPQRNTFLALFGGVTLLFVTLVFPIQFEKQWITIGWALEGAALLWLHHRVPHEGLRLAGVGLLLSSFVRLALNPAAYHYYERSGAPILNWYLYTYGLVILSLGIAARLMNPPRNKIGSVDMPPILQGLGVVLAFLLMNIDIADYFSTGKTIVFQFSGSFARDMAYSLGWSLFAFVLLAAGIRRQSRTARYAGLGLLTAALVKLFLHDLWSLGGLYRVGSLIGLALVLFPVSYLYQRFPSKDPQQNNP